MKLQIVGHSMSLSMLRVDIAYREELLRISGQAANYISSGFYVKKPLICLDQCRLWIASRTSEIQGHHEVCNTKRRGPRTLSRKQMTLT